jgi:hypothetical protein
MSAFLGFSRGEFDGLRQYALQRGKIHSIKFDQGRINFFRKRLCVIDRCLNPSYWPSQMIGGRSQVMVVAANHEHDLPDSETATLDAGLPPRG